MLRKVLIVLTASLCPAVAFAQGGNIGSNSSPVMARNGQLIAGANVSICQPLATTAASVTSNLAVLTMTSNPITAGFVAGMTIQVAGFAGGDTYFNGGTFSGTGITNGFTILSVTSTTIAYSLTHANGTASSNGTVLQIGNATTSCAGLSTITSDPALLNTVTQPLATDGNGNWNAYATPGFYYAQFYGPAITTTLRQFAIACVPSASTVTCGAQLNGTNPFTGPQSFSNTSLGVQSGPTNGGFTIGAKPAFDQVWYNTPINLGTTTTFKGGTNYSGSPNEGLLGLEMLVNPTTSSMAYVKAPLWVTIMDADPDPLFSGGVNLASSAGILKCIIPGTADSPGANTTGACGPTFNPVGQIDAGGDGAVVVSEIDLTNLNTYTGTTAIGTGVNKHVDEAEPNKLKTWFWFNNLGGNIPGSWLLDSPVNRGLSLNGISLRGVANPGDSVCTQAVSVNGGTDTCGQAIQISNGSLITSRNAANNASLDMIHVDASNILHIGLGTTGGTVQQSEVINSYTSAHTVTTNEGIIQANAGGGSFTLTIPHGLKQKWFITRLDSSGNILTLTCDSGFINNIACGTGITLASSATDMCYADGSNVWCK